MTTEGITWEWNTEWMDMMTCRLGDEVGMGLCAPSASFAWPNRLAANLAMAALLNKACHLGYENGSHDVRVVSACEANQPTPCRCDEWSRGPWPTRSP